MPVVNEDKLYGPSRYALAVDAKLADANPSWEEFVELRQKNDTEQAELQNEKVLKVLALKDARIKECEEQLKEAETQRQGLDEERRQMDVRETEMLADLQELERLREREGALFDKRLGEVRGERDRVGEVG